MKQNLKSSTKTLRDFFAEKPNLNQKAWKIIHDFYHFLLTHMEKNNITQADLARRLNKSRSAISQMFNKNPNVSIRKLVEIADAVELEFKIVPTDHKQENVHPIYYIFINNHNQSTDKINISQDKYINLQREAFQFDFNSNTAQVSVGTEYAKC